MTLDSSVENEHEAVYPSRVSEICLFVHSRLAHLLTSILIEEADEEVRKLGVDGWVDGFRIAERNGCNFRRSPGKPPDPKKTGK